MKCKNCNKKEAVKFSKYASGEFCSVKCTKAFSTKGKRKEIGAKIREKLKGTGNGDVTLVCKTCKKAFDVEYRRRYRKYCSNKCRYEREVSDETRQKLSKARKKVCESLDERMRLRDIGRKGGFGKKGYTEGGTRYESSLEKKCYEWLEKRKVQFEPHKQIPSSSKVSDVYFKKENVWVELDGIDREKRKEWLGKQYKYWRAKIDLYESLELKYEVIKSFDEFKAWCHENIGV